MGGVGLFYIIITSGVLLVGLPWLTGLFPAFAYHTLSKDVKKRNRSTNTYLRMENLRSVLYRSGSTDDIDNKRIAINESYLNNVEKVLTDYKYMESEKCDLINANKSPQLEIKREIDKKDTKFEGIDRDNGVRSQIEINKEGTLVSTDTESEIAKIKHEITFGCGNEIVEPTPFKDNDVEDKSEILFKLKNSYSPIKRNKLMHDLNKKLNSVKKLFESLKSESGKKDNFDKRKVFKTKPNEEGDATIETFTNYEENICKNSEVKVNACFKPILSSICLERRSDDCRKCYRNILPSKCKIDVVNDKCIKCTLPPKCIPVVSFDSCRNCKKNNDAEDGLMEICAEVLDNDNKDDNDDKDDDDDDEVTDIENSIKAECNLNICTQTFNKSLPMIRLECKIIDENESLLYKIKENLGLDTKTKCFKCHRPKCSDKNNCVKLKTLIEKLKCRCGNKMNKKTHVCEDKCTDFTKTGCGTQTLSGCIDFKDIEIATDASECKTTDYYGCDEDNIDGEDNEDFDDEFDDLNDSSYTYVDEHKCKCLQKVLKRIAISEKECARNCKDEILKYYENCRRKASDIGEFGDACDPNGCKVNKQCSVRIRSSCCECKFSSNTSSCKVIESEKLTREVEYSEDSGSQCASDKSRRYCKSCVKQKLFPGFKLQVGVQAQHHMFIRSEQRNIYH